MDTSHFFRVIHRAVRTYESQDNSLWAGSLMTNQPTSSVERNGRFLLLLPTTMDFTFLTGDGLFLLPLARILSIKELLADLVGLGLGLGLESTEETTGGWKV